MSSASAPLRVGILCHSGLGGSSRAAVRLANALARRGHHVHLCSLSRLAWRVAAGVRQHHCHAQRRIRPAGLYWDWTEADRRALVGLLLRVQRSERLQVLHFHYAQPFASIVAELAGGLSHARPRVVGTLHGTDLSRCVADSGEQTRLRMPLAQADAVTCVSAHLAGVARRLWPETAVEVLPNFVEDSWGRGSRPGPGPMPVLLHASNFRPVKNVRAVVEIFLALQRQLPCELWLVGDGPERVGVQALLAGSAAHEHVRYFGARETIEDLLSQATLLLSASLEEGFSLTVLEAMASGVPALATAVGGVPELVCAGEDGLLFAPDDPQAAVASALRLLRSPAAYARMSQAASARAQPLREGRVIGRYEALYQRVCGSLRAAPALP